MFKGPNGFAKLMNIQMCIVMCVVLSVVIPITVEQTLGITGVLTPIGFVQGFVLSYFVSYLWGDLLPAVMWGTKLGMAMHARGFAAYLVKTIVVAVVYITVISFSMAFVNNIVEGGMAGVWGFWTMVYLPALISGWVFIALFLGLCTKIGVALSGFDPKAGDRQAQSGSVGEANAA